MTSMISPGCHLYFYFDTDCVRSLHGSCRTERYQVSQFSLLFFGFLMRMVDCFVYYYVGFLCVVFFQTLLKMYRLGGR